MPGLLLYLMSQMSARISSRRLERFRMGPFQQVDLTEWVPTLAHGTYPLASPPRGPGFRVHHIQFLSQLLSPQEALCCIIKKRCLRPAPYLNTHSHLTGNKKKKDEKMNRSGRESRTVSQLVTPLTLSLQVSCLFPCSLKSSRIFSGKHLKMYPCSF